MPFLDKQDHHSGAAVKPFLPLVGKIPAPTRAIHASGYWHTTRRDYSDETVFQVDSDTQEITRLVAYLDTMDTMDSVEANARLIAAAPELLAFVRDFAEGDRETMPLKLMQKEAVALIAKAEGF